MSLKQYIRDSIAAGRDFAVFRLPGEKVWHTDTEPGWSLRAVPYDRCEPFLPEATDTNSYLASVATLRDVHRRRGGKTVLSRIIRGTLSDNIDIADACKSYFEANPGAFCTLVSRRETGTWIIATPELLLYADSVWARTMSLAGTRPADTDEPWDTKNIEEQAIVTRFILDEWRRIGLDPVAEAPMTLRSNRVEHICTRINARLSSEIDIDTILEHTSPTPAVCGMPRYDARHLIEQHEAHSRGLYAGYIAVAHGDTIRAFVTLRCARLDADGSFAVYAGGGITADSIPENELRETRLKASAIIEALTGQK